MRAVQAKIWILILTLSMTLSACSDFAVILNQPPKAASLREKITSSIDAEGRLQLDWSLYPNASSKSFQIYLKKDARETTYSEAVAAESSELLLNQYVEMLPAEAPKLMGELIATVEGSSFTYPEIMDQESNYLFQIVDSVQARSKGNATVYLAQLNFVNASESQASLASEKKVAISWDSVPGATSYEICLAADGNVLTTTEGTSITVDTLAANYWIRPKRGQLVSKSLIKVSLNQSSVKFESFASLASDGSYSTGETLDFVAQFSDAVTVFGEAYIAFPLESGEARALYVSGSGSKVLRFRYSVQAGDNVSSLKPNALLEGEILDSAGLTISKEVPGGENAFIAKHHLAIDSKAPTPPSSVGFSDSWSRNGAASVAWVKGSDAHLAHHLVKLCSDSACSSGCVQEKQSQDSPASFAALNDGLYFACVKAVDAQDLTSAWIPSLSSLVVDKNAPAVQQLGSSLANGSYKAGQNILIHVTFTETVFFSGTATLALNSTGTAHYVSGSGSDSLVFQYSVGAGENSNDLDVASANALSLSGSIRDAAGNDASLTIPASGQGKRLAEAKDIVIDNNPPTAPSAVAFLQALASGSYLSATWTNGSDAHFKTHNVKLCTASDCNSGCRSSETSLVSPKSLLSTSGTAYYACVQSEDHSGLKSAWVASLATASSDSDLPVVTSINSSTVAGYYKSGDSISIALQFSEDVTVSNSGDLRLLLETGATDRSATYVSGSGSSTLIFSYTVQNTDGSADLNYQSRNALSLGASGSIRDASGNDASLLLPDLSDSGSLATQEALVIDTTLPGNPSAVSFDSALSGSGDVEVSWNASTDSNFLQHSIRLCVSNDCSTGCLAAVNAASSPLTLTAPHGNSYYACVRGEDRAGLSSSWIASLGTVSIDTAAPTVLSVSPVTADGAYKAGAQIEIDVQFSETVTVLSGGDLGLLLETGGSDRSATYISGSGSGFLRFRYTVQSGDSSADLNYESAAALSPGASGSIRDAAGNNASLALPATNHANSLGENGALVIDTTAPSPPSAIAFASPTGESLNFDLSWTPSIDANLSNHSVKLCPSSACSTGCLSPLSSLTSPLTMTGANGGIYYGCIQGIDSAGNLSAWVASAGTHTVDTSFPVVTNVTVTEASGIYKSGDTLSIQLTFSKTLTVTNGNDLRLRLETGATDREASYTTGSGSNVLTFEYTVQAGDAASDLDYESTSALSLGASGSITDSVGRNAVLNLPAPGTASSIAGQKALVIDTAAPSAPSSVGFARSVTNAAAISTSWSLSMDNNFKTHHLKLCTQNDCSTGCTSVVDSTTSPADLTGAAGSSYYACVQGEDLAAQFSAWVPSLGTVRFDNTAPTVVNVTASTADGHYKAGAAVAIEIEFSEALFASDASSIALELETGTTDRSAVYSSGEGSDTLLLTYTAQAGDSSEDLEAKALSSLTHSGTLQDAGGNNVNLALPALGGPASLSGQKALVIDTTAPTNPASVSFASPTGASLTFDVDYTSSSDDHFQTHNVKICTNSNCTGGCLTSTTSAATPASVTGVNGPAYYGCVRGRDLAGNVSAWVASSGTHTIDTANPTIINVTSTSTDATYRAGDPLNFQIQFSKIVTVAGSGDLRLTLETGATDGQAVYSGGSGTDTLTFIYSVAAADNSQDLDVNALSLGATGDIEDTGGNDATLTLPSPGDPQSLSGQKSIIIDNTLPTPPSAIVFASSATNAASISTSWTPSTDANFRQHNLKLCEQNDCATDCTASIDSVGSPAALSGSVGKVYYACVRGEDWIVQRSAWVASAGTVSFDQTAPTVVDVRSGGTANGYYKAGASIAIEVEFSEAVYASAPGSLALKLETGSTDRSATYVSGHGSNILVFTYAVQAGDTSPDLNAEALNALTHSGTLRDLAGNNAVLTLPSLAGPDSIASQHNIVIDSTLPDLPTAVGFNAANGESLSFNLNWTLSADTNFDTHEVKICSAANCSSGCRSELNSATSPAVVTGVHAGVYYGCVRGKDLAGNFSAWAASVGTHTIDASNPTISSVTASTGDGAYNAGDILTIQVSFSKTVQVTGGSDIKLLLETGATDREASYSTGSGSPTLNFTYTVQSGDSSADLDFASTGALTLGASGDIEDSASHNAVLTLPAPGSPSSLAGQKALVIDTTLPTSPSSIGFASPATNGASMTTSWSASIDSYFSTHRAKLCALSDCTTTCTTPVAVVGNSTALSGTAGNSYYACVRGEDTAGNLSPWIASATQVSFDTTAPTVSNVTSSSGDASYKAGQTISIQVSFSEAVFASNAASLALGLETGDDDRSATYVSGDGSSTINFSYTVQAGDTSADLNAKSTSSLIFSGTLRDAAGNNANATLPALAGAQSLATQKNIVIDTTAPAAPMILSPSGTYSTTAISTVSGTAENNASVSVSDGSTLLGTVSANGSGNWTLNLGSPLSDGSYSIRAKATDAALNESVASTAVAITVDTSGPVAPTIGALVTPTNDTTPELFGTSEPNMAITIYRNAAQIATTTANGSGNWTSSATSFAQGGYTITATATDPGNRTSSASSGAAITIDTTAPTVTGVTSNKADGTYGIGQAIDVRVIFSENVVITGSPQIEMEAGTSDPFATAPSGSGTSTLVFSFTTANPHATNDLDYKATTSLSGGTIKDAAGNSATLTLPAPGTAGSLGANKAIAIETVQPTVTSVLTTTASGAYGPGNVIPIQVTFSEAVTVTGTPTIRMNTATPTDVSYTSTASNVVTFNYTVASGATSADFDHSSTSALTGTIKDANGNDAILTLPAPNTAATTIGGTKNIQIAGNSVAPVLSASLSSQNAFSNAAITSVNVSANGGTDFDADGQPVTYVCTYDTVIDGAVSAGTACSSLPQTTFSFSASTGVLDWNPGASAVASLAAISPYEFRVQGTDTTNMSASVIYTVNLLRPFSTTWTIDVPANFTHGSSISTTGSKAMLVAKDQTDDDDTSTGFDGGTKLGVTWDTDKLRMSHNMAACNSNTQNCSELDLSWMNYGDVIHTLNFNNSFSPETVGTSGSPTFLQTRKNGSHSLYFSGSDAIAFPRKTLGDDMTVSVWFQSTQVLSHGGCDEWHEGGSLVTTETGGDVNDWGITFCNGYVIAGVGNPNALIKSIYTHADGVWHNVVFTRVKSTGVIKLFIDGILQGTATGGTQTLSSASQVRIGHADGVATMFNGFIDTFFTMGVALTETQIWQLYERQAPRRAGMFTSRMIDSGLITPPWWTLSWLTTTPAGKPLPDQTSETATEYPGITATSLMSGNVGLYHFSESSGTLDDDSPTNANATMVGTAGTHYRLGAPGRFGKGIEFYGNGTSYVDAGAPNAHDFGSNSFTVSTWFRTHNDWSNVRMVSNGYANTSGSPGFAMMTQSTGKLGFGVGSASGGSANVFIETTTRFTDGAWHHAVGVVNRSTNRIIIYVDGVKQTIQTHSWGPCGASASSSTEWNISSCSSISGNSSYNTSIGGFSSGWDLYVGILDEVGLWNRALSEEEARNLYRRGATNLKFQVRSCPTTDCSGVDWKGSDGTKTSYYSELNNNAQPSTLIGTTLNTQPTITFTNFAGNNIGNTRYFQYRTIFETDDVSNCTYGNCSAELTDVIIGPDHYSGSSPTVVGPSRPFYSLASFSHTYGTGDCTSGVKYQISTDATNWKWWNGTAWVTGAVDVLETNTPAQITTNAATFATQVGRSTFYWRAFLQSTGTSKCELTGVTFTGNSSY